MLKSDKVDEVLAADDEADEVKAVDEVLAGDDEAVDEDGLLCLDAVAFLMESFLFFVV